MEKFAVTRLIGAPPGYVGYDEGGQLTEAVRRRPYSVVLFDEIEKAHPDVFNILLQVLDDGRLTDGQGRVVDFRNVIIIMTSNLGSDLILDASSVQEVEPKIKELLKASFRPEFLNRIDEVITFNRLGENQILSILDIQFKKVEERLKERRLFLEITPEVKQYIAKVGYDPLYGARPLKRAVQNELENPLAKEVLSGRFIEGDSIVAKKGENGIIFEKK